MGIDIISTLIYNAIRNTKTTAPKTKGKNTMKNEQIIFNTALKLMNENKIGTTGRTITFVNEKNEKITVPEPEPIHTFATWKAIGFSVKKGQHAIAKINIWKYCQRTGSMEVTTDDGNTETVETDNSKMIMKEAFFFSLSQVEKTGKATNKIPTTETTPATAAAPTEPAPAPETITETPTTEPAPETAPAVEKAARKSDVEKAIEKIEKSAAKNNYHFNNGTFENTAYATDTFQLIKTTAATTESRIEKSDAEKLDRILESTKDFNNKGNLNITAKELKAGIKEAKAGRRNAKVVFTTADGITLNANYLLNALTATGTSEYRFNTKKNPVIFENDTTTYLICPINARNVETPATGISVID